ncbi:MAG: VanW family protein [Candidatus Paceibacterota bacterium]|jgi:vancomycin resistance protein VanW
MIEAIQEYVKEYERPKRKAISSRFPILVGPAVFTKRLLRGARNKITLTKFSRAKYLSSVVARHSSLLYRKLGDSDADLQINKVTNLKLVVPLLDGLVIPPGQTFSLWNVIGRISKKRGFVDGMLLSNGKVSKGVGGGLCQLSNFLFWIMLHADVEIVERHHHSMDVFPDSGRTLPFGSGATIFDNYLDLKIKNISSSPIQIKLWLTDICLKGQILSNRPSEKKFHIVEKNHCFINRGGKYFRYNELYRETYRNGAKIDEQKIFVNFVPVLYPITEEYIDNQHYQLIKL